MNARILRFPRAGLHTNVPSIHLDPYTAQDPCAVERLIINHVTPYLSACRSNGLVMDVHMDCPAGVVRDGRDGPVVAEITVCLDQPEVEEARS